MNIRTQKFLVLGVSKSGTAVANYLLDNGATCYIYEELNVKSAQNAVSELVNRGAIELKKDNAFSVLNDILVLSYFAAGRYALWIAKNL